MKQVIETVLISLLTLSSLAASNLGLSPHLKNITQASQILTPSDITLVKILGVTGLSVLHASKGDHLRVLDKINSEADIQKIMELVRVDPASDQDARRGILESTVLDLNITEAHVASRVEVQANLVNRLELDIEEAKATLDYLQGEKSLQEKSEEVDNEQERRISNQRDELKELDLKLQKERKELNNLRDERTLLARIIMNIKNGDIVIKNDDIADRQ